MVFDLINALGIYTVVGFADSGKPVGETVAGNARVLCTPGEITTQIADAFVVAIGHNPTRANWYMALRDKLKPDTFIHPSAVVSPSAFIEPGCVILPNAVVNAGCVIGENTIVNSLALVDHDTTVGSHVHISQGAVIGSNCRIHDNTIIALGQHVQSGQTI